MDNLRDGYLSYGFSVVSKDHHHVIDDIEKFIQIVSKNNILYENGMIPKDLRRKLFRKKLFSEDEQYIYYIDGLCTGLGLIKTDFKKSKDMILTNIREIDEFQKLSNENKLKKIREVTYIDCMDRLSSFDDIFNSKLTMSYVKQLFKKPFEISKLTEEILVDDFIAIAKSALGLLENIEVGVQVENHDTEEMIEKISKFAFVVAVLDVNLLSVWSYYLGFIQPLFSQIYSIYDEMDIIEAGIDDEDYLRAQMSGMYEKCDITYFGDSVLNNKKSKKEQVIKEKITVGNLEKIIDEGFHNTEEIDFSQVKDLLEDFFQKTDGVNELSDLFNKSKASENTVYTLRVKIYENKRNYKDIEISSNNTLDDLSNEIQDVFHLESGHLYSFFMGKKFWDSKNEYVEPQTKQYKLSAFNFEMKDKFLYLHDYGDENRFEIEVRNC